MPKRSMGFMPMASCGGVVVVFDPVGELAVEGFERGEVELLDEELVADAAEEAFDFALGGGVADGGMAQDAADAGADEGDFLGAVDRAVVDEQLLGDAAFVEGGADGLTRVSTFSSKKNSPWQRTRLASSMKAMSLACLREPGDRPVST